MNPLPTYEDADIAARLTGPLASWRLEDGHLCRTYRTGAWKSSLMVVNAIGHLAELAWHHPDLEVGFMAVTVRLQTHDANGITDRDFELAAKIESFIGWQPRREGGALEGTPDDPQFRYLNGG